MHNRKVSNKAAILPVYSTDSIDNASAGNSWKPQKRFRPNQQQLQNIYKSILITLTIIIFFCYVIRDLPPEDENETIQIHQLHVDQDKILTLTDEFPSLTYPLEHSALVGLYFAASWCPDSSPVTKMLDDLFRDILVKPPTSESDTIAGDVSLDGQNNSKFSIVYISSDLIFDEMSSYVKPNWFVIPFENRHERSNIKKYYKTCAKRELQELGIERQREIPSLIILSGETHHVLTYNGIHDIKDYGVKAVDHWLELDRLNFALLGKY